MVNFFQQGSMIFTDLRAVFSALGRLHYRSNSTITVFQILRFLLNSLKLLYQFLPATCSKSAYTFHRSCNTLFLSSSVKTFHGFTNSFLGIQTVFSGTKYQGVFRIYENHCSRISSQPAYNPSPSLYGPHIPSVPDAVHALPPNARKQKNGLSCLRNIMVLTICDMR